MLTQQLALSEDIQRLIDEGYNVDILASHLVVSGVPYVTPSCKIDFGTLFYPLQMSGATILPPSDHTARFDGEHPCDQFGTPNKTYVNSQQLHSVTNEVTAKFYFSAKPEYQESYYTKMKRYSDLLSAPAKSIDPSVCAQRFDYQRYATANVFHYPDTNTARAGIAGLTRKVAGQKLAVIGLGGTGAYVLDFVSKTEVAEIHLFDADEMNNHNAFRIPGAISLEELAQRQSKAQYLGGVYTKMRQGIIIHDVFVDESNVADITGFDFVFLAIDNPGAKGIIIDHLRRERVPFIDLGMGLTYNGDSLRGMLRSTLITDENAVHLGKIPTDGLVGNDPYTRNIQIAELNALNAIMGVMAWKKLYGFYLRDEMHHNATFIVDEGVMCLEA